MTQKSDTLGRLSELRERAQAALTPVDTGLSYLSREDICAVVLELQTHQLELAMQNDELLAVQAELVKSRDRYSELYNFAPVGYLGARGKKALIFEANLTLARLLALGRHDLVEHPLSDFVFPEDQDVLYFHLQEATDSKQLEKCELRLLRSRTEPLWVELKTILIEENGEGDDRFRVAVSDITRS